jgi:hypothetical protein
MSEQLVAGDSEQRVWRDIEPHLDELVGRLHSADRDALLLRFYRQLSLADVGAALGVSEEAARKRVAKAISRLRRLLAGHGTDISAGAMAGPLLAMTTHPAPPSLVETCTAPHAAASTAVGIAKGVILMSATKTKAAVAAVILAILLITAGGLMLARTGDASPPALSLPTAAVRAPAPRPPEAQLIANREQCARNLADLLIAISMYRQQRAGVYTPSRRGGTPSPMPTPQTSLGEYPPDLRSLVLETDWNMKDFTCPNSGTIAPDSREQRMGLTARADWVASHSDFVLVPNVPADANSATVLMYEKDHCEFGDGVHVAYVDGRIEFLSLAAAHGAITSSTTTSPP